MELIDKEVYFHEYCPKCVHKDKAENEDPCWDCLNEPMNAESHKPINFKEDTHVGKNRKTVKRAKRNRK